MGVTIIGKRKEEIEHLARFAKDNIQNVKKMLIIYLIPTGRSEEDVSGEIEPVVKEIAKEIPYEIKTFTGSPDMALETFLARREDIRMVFLHIEKLDIKELLEEETVWIIAPAKIKGEDKVIQTPSNNDNVIKNYAKHYKCDSPPAEPFPVLFYLCICKGC